MLLTSSEIDGMRSREVRWGDYVQREIAIPASAVPGFVDVGWEQKTLVDVKDVARLWGVRLGIHTNQDVPAAEVCNVRFQLVAGLGQSQFEQIKTLSFTGPIVGVPDYGFDVTTFLPDYPFQTLIIRARADYTYGAGAARKFALRMQAAVAPYTLARHDA